MLNKRQNKIIMILKNSNSWITGKSLGENLSVSDRTIRSDIDKINKNYIKPIIISDRHKGYLLSDIYNKSKLTILENDVCDNGIPQTPDERVNYIIKKLLLDDKEISLNKLQEEIFVSEYSLEADLRKVREYLAEFPNLKLSRFKSYICLNGNEEEKRKLYKVLLEKETMGNFLNMDKLASFFKNIDLFKIKDILEKTLKEYNFHIREMSLPMLMIHIGISLERLLKRNYVVTDISKEEICNSIEYKISTVFFERVNKLLNVDIVDDEILRLALLLMGKKNNRFKSKDIALNSSTLPLNDIVDKILQKIYEKFSVDLRYDTELKIGLCIHLQGVEERQKQNINLENVYLQEIKQNYSLVFEMAIWAGNVICDYTGYTITEDEIGFIALHLGSAYERISSSNKYKAMIIFPKEKSFDNSCLNKISNRFIEKMEIIGCDNVFEEKKVLELNPDLIITTLPLQHNLSIPTVQISLFVNYEDEGKIFYTLYDLEKKKNHDLFEQFIKKMMYPDLFYNDLDMSSSKDIINYMCDKLYEKKLVPSEFKESVFKREEYSFTSISNGIAIPHALNVQANDSCVSVAILKKPIIWGQFKVYMIILLATAEKDNKLTSIFFEWLSSLISSPDKLAKVLEIKSYDDFINLFD